MSDTKQAAMSIEMADALTGGVNIDALLASVVAATQARDFKDRVITGDEVEFWDSPKIGIPHGMTYKKARGILERLEEEAETITVFDRVFRYRPDDGAYAAYQTMKKMYGIVLGKGTWFSDAEQRTINIGPGGQTMQVPWGLLELPVFPGLELYIQETKDRDYGTIFQMYARGPKKYKAEIEALFDEVALYLQEHSIYRGQAIIGADRPEFLDLTTFDPTKIVFADDVEAILQGTLEAPIRYTQTFRDERVPLKRALLLEGPFGTGKTSIGQRIAQIAVENKWTFISAKPGRDKVEDVLRTARLYQPAVVFIEDIDTQSASGDDDAVTKLLEAFDGITSKGGELQVVMTTNHIGRIHKGMLRPGRLDAVVHIGALDRNGVERLIKAVVPWTKLEDDIDYDQVYETMEGYLPAFIRESVTRAVTFAINRLAGKREYTIGTEDLCNAALSLRPQLAHLENANEGERVPSLDAAFAQVVKDNVVGLGVADSHHEHLPIVELDEDGVPVTKD